MTIEWHDFAGTIGVVCVVAAYWLLSVERWQSKSLKFSALNALGAALVLLSLSQDFNLSAFLVESFWLLISLYGIYRNGFPGSAGPPASNAGT